MVRSSHRRQCMYEVRQCIKFAFLYHMAMESSSEEESDEESDEESNEESDRSSGEESHTLSDETMDHSSSESSSSESASESDDEDVLFLLHSMYGALQESRYIKERLNEPKSREYIQDFFGDQSPENFRAMTRLNKQVFEYVVDLIKDDPVFQCASNHKQAPVHVQLACALDRLGNDGQGVSADRSKVTWGIGHGTVWSYYKRCVHALCKLRFRFIKWSNAEERNRISSDMEQLGFKGAVGFVDGTVFPLYGKPSYAGNDYLDRKRNYSINAQVVCDNRHQIVHFMSGMPGSCHDSRIFSNSELVTNPEQYFSPGQYLIADSAYAASTYLVPAYKSRQRDNPNDPDEPALIDQFNTYLAKARVVNEHTIGILKSRWTSLRCLRIDLRKPDDILSIIKHTVACVVLHNIATAMDAWEDELVTLDAAAEDEALQAEDVIHGQTPGQRQRYHVRRQCLAFFEEQGPRARNFF